MAQTAFRNHQVPLPIRAGRPVSPLRPLGAQPALGARLTRPTSPPWLSTHLGCGRRELFSSCHGSVPSTLVPARVRDSQLLPAALTNVIQVSEGEVEAISERGLDKLVSQAPCRSPLG